MNRHCVRSSAPLERRGANGALPVQDVPADAAEEPGLVCFAQPASRVPRRTGSRPRWSSLPGPREEHASACASGSLPWVMPPCGVGQWIPGMPGPFAGSPILSLHITTKVIWLSSLFFIDGARSRICLYRIVPVPGRFPWTLSEKSFVRFRPGAFQALSVLRIAS